MPTALLVQTANALTDLVNASSFTGLQFKAVRSWADWDDDTDEDEGLRVDVVGIGNDRGELLSRDRMGYETKVDVYIRKTFGQKHRDQTGRIQVAEIDRLVLLVEEIHQLLAKEQFESDLGISWISGEILANFSRKHLREKGMFFGAVQFILRTSAAV